MAVLSKGNLFPEELVPGLIQKTIGASALAKLCGAQPIPFNGMKEFTFTLDNEIDIVAENGKKTAGGGSVGTRTIVPLKVEYSMRVSDEFMYASEEYQMNVLQAFSEGFARKMAKGFDLMAMHGINPRSKAASTLIGNNCFDKAVTNAVTIASGDTPDGNVEAAVALVQAAERDVSGMIMAPAFKSSLAAMRDKNDNRVFPNLAWGASASEINGLRVESTSNLSFNSSTDRAIVGDFANAFRWGYAKQIPVEVIEYGNPDNDTTNGDLKGRNQVLIRAEAYIGWSVLEPEAFALIKSAT